MSFRKDIREINWVALVTVIVAIAVLIFLSTAAFHLARNLFV